MRCRVWGLGAPSLIFKVRTFLWRSSYRLTIDGRTYSNTKSPVNSPFPSIGLNEENPCKFPYHRLSVEIRKTGENHRYRVEISCADKGVKFVIRDIDQLLDLLGQPAFSPGKGLCHDDGTDRLSARGSGAGIERNFLRYRRHLHLLRQGSAGAFEALWKFKPAGLIVVPVT